MMFGEGRGLDEVLEMLDRTTKRIQKNVDETKDFVSKHAQIYEQLQQSSYATQEQKMKAFIKRTLDLDRLEHLNSQLSLLYLLQIFAFKVKVLEVSVDNIKDQLVKSGVLQSGEELEDIKKNIDALKILIEAHYESMKEINESQKQNLGYIH
jgi:phage terminase large subunit-like protein